VVEWLFDISALFHKSVYKLTDLGCNISIFVSLVILMINFEKIENLIKQNNGMIFIVEICGNL